MSTYNFPIPDELQESENTISDLGKTSFKFPIPDELETRKTDLHIDYEDDSERLYDKERTDIVNDIRYGWNQSQAGFFHLLANVPGGLQSLKEFAGNVTGIDSLTNEGKLANLEGYLRDLSDANNPESLGLDTPDTLTGKVLQGFARLPLTFAQYYGPMRILKSLPMSMALVDGIHASDKGLSEAAVAAGKGAIMGKLINAANVLRLPERVGALGALGFSTAGGGLEDRVAGALVFGALGVAPTGQRGLSAKDIKQTLTGQNKHIVDALNVKGGEWQIFKEKLGETDKLLNKKELQIDNYKKRKRVNKNQLEKFQKELSDLLLSRKKTTDSMDILEKSMYTIDKIGKNMILDNRPAIVAKADLFTKQGKAKYEDLKNFTHKYVAGYFAPMKFLVKNPITKWTADYMSKTRISIENKVESILYDPKLRPLKFMERKIDKDKLLRGDLEGIKFGGATALRNIQRIESDGAALTRFDKMYNKDWRKLEDTIQKAFRIEFDKVQQYQKKKTDRIKEVTDAELKNVYKLDKEQILVYKDLRQGMDTVHKFYNAYVNKYVKTLTGKSAQEIAKIGTELPYIPNYMPHMFLGDFRVYVNKKTNPNKDPEFIAPANNPWSAKTHQKNLQEKFGNKYKVTIHSVNTNNISRRGVAAFEEAMLYAERLGKSDVAKEMHSLYTKSIAGKGFKKHSVRRKYVPGQAGTEAGLRGILDFKEGYQTYVRGAISKAYGFKARRDTSILLDDSKVIAQYGSARNLATTYRENALGAQANKISEVTANLGRKWIGENGVGNALGVANVVTLNLKLLFGNLRFMAAQYIQPFQMIPAKLLQLEAQGIKGDMWRSVIEAQRSLVLPGKTTREFIEYLAHQRVVEPKFLQEFASDVGFKAGKIAVGKNFVFDAGKITDVFTMRKMTGRVEQYSRMNAGLMFYHFLKRGGIKEQKAREDAAHLADKYMVEYNSYERPLIYGEAGLGTAGKPFGLFKTFQHNYFAQLMEHIRSIKVGEIKKGDLQSTKGFVAFAGTMVVTAGALNIIGIEVADRLINRISPVWERLFNKRPQTVTEALLTSDLPDWVKWGAPSALLEADLTTTLAAPGLGLQDLVSVPSLEVLGLHPGQMGFPLFKQRKGGVMQAGFGWAYKKSMGMATEADAQKFYKSISPTSFQGIIEAYYNGGAGVFFDEDKSLLENFLPWVEKDKTKTHLIRDPWKKSRGEFRRNIDDWRTRLFASYSLKEATYLKTVYSLSVIDRNASLNQQSIVSTAAHLIVNGETMPQWLFEMSISNNVLPKTFLAQIKNRIKLMNTTLLDREFKKKNILRRADTFDLIMPLIS